MALKTLYSCVLLFHRIGGFFSRCGSRLHLSLGSGERAVGFDGRDDDLLKFLQGIPDVPAFKDILWKVEILKFAGSHTKKSLINMLDILHGSPFQET